MAYIDTKHLFKCETCRSMRSGECTSFCDSGECYSPDISKIPAADIVEVVRCWECKYYKLWHMACIYPHHNELNGVNGYCNYGERRDT